MRAVAQRVSKAKVSVEDETVGRIGPGILLLLGIGQGDGESDLKYMLDKTLNLRIFEDENRKMNLSLIDVGKELLVVSQFTLYGDCRKGRRPGFSSSAPPEIAEKLYEQFVKEARLKGIKTQTGRFAAMMDVELVNDGPVTLLLDSNRLF